MMSAEHFGNVWSHMIVSVHLPTTRVSSDSSHDQCLRFLSASIITLFSQRVVALLYKLEDVFLWHVFT